MIVGPPTAQPKQIALVPPRLARCPPGPGGGSEAGREAQPVSQMLTRASARCRLPIRDAFRITEERGGGGDKAPEDGGRNREDCPAPTG